MGKFDSIIRKIVKTQGGNREKEILKSPYTIERAETWNDEHKVLNIYAIKNDAGHQDGFSIDIVRGKICG